jgi:hypothetical protein
VHLRFLVVALALSLGTAGCGEDPDVDRTGDDPTTVATSGSPTADPTTACAELIPDTALTSLGWTASAAAGEQAGRCERSAGSSVVTVGAVGTGRDRYDERCALLPRDNTPEPEVDPDWIGTDVTACVRAFPTGADTGVAKAVLLTDDDRVVEIQLAADVPTPGERLRAGLAALASSAEATY